MNPLVAAVVIAGSHLPDGLRTILVPPPAEMPVVGETAAVLVFKREYVLGPFDPGFEWDEMIPSWNLPSPLASITFDASLEEPSLDSSWYSFGTWMLNSNGLRGSVVGSKDARAEVQTDTLVTKSPERKVWIRARLSAYGQGNLNEFPFLTLNFLRSGMAPSPGPPNKKAWGKVIEAPRLSQMSYEGGNVWCSPTCVAMILRHWAKVQGDPKIAKDVPEVVASVHDPNWPGTGNWPFNVAYAGSFPGMRAYVSRFGSIVELEDWIAAGIPVVTSVSSAMLNGKPAKEPNDGHLVVLVGFTKSGDPVFNDPGRSVEIRQIYMRDDFKRAWAASKNTVYLIYPRAKKPPPNRLGHWLD